MELEVKMMRQVQANCGYFYSSDTSFVMHFISQTVNSDDDKIRHTFMGGYTNGTSLHRRNKI